MRVLLLGVADSLWMKRYVEWVLDGASFDVLLEDADASRYADWYRGEGVGSLPFRSAAESGPSSKLATFRSFFREVREAADRIIEIDGLECAHLHFLDMRNLLLALALKRRNPNLRIVASFWGSDLLRARAAERLIMSWSLRVCDAVTIQDRESMLMPFHGRFGTRFDEKLFPVLFPGENNALQGIAEKESRAESCEMLSIPADKQVVAIGYNANPNHQHVTVLNQLSRMPEDCRQRMHILLPMTYPSISDGYRAELMAALEGLGSTSTIIEGFQSDEAIARMQRVSTVMIHAQTSDAASASIKEFLRAGAVLLNPSWIDYCELRGAGVDYIEYDEIAEIPGLLQQVLDGSLSSDTAGNMALLQGCDSMNREIVEGWHEVYSFIERRR